jgi:hypothetical protein
MTEIALAVLACILVLWLCWHAVKCSDRDRYTHREIDGDMHYGE